MGNGPSFAKIATLMWYRDGVAHYGAPGFARNAAAFADADLCSVRRPFDGQPLLHGRRVLITGANQGIGLATATQCAALGATVHLLCRSPAKAEAAADRIRSAYPTASVVVDELDVSDFAAVRRFAAAFNQSSPPLEIHALVNNAGCMPSERTVAPEGREAIVATTLGGLLLAQMLRPAIRDGGRVVNVSSGGQYLVAPRIADLDLPELSGKAYDGRLVYAYAKRWQVQLTLWLAEAERRSAASGGAKRVAHYAMHPGWAETTAVHESLPGFTEQQAKRGNPLRTPAQGADTVVFLVAATDEMIRSAAAASGPAWTIAESLLSTSNDQHSHHSHHNTGDSPCSGTFWFDRKVVPWEMGYGTAWSGAQRAELAAAAAKYLGLRGLGPEQ